MDPITTIGAILTSLKTATEITRFFENTDSDFDEAESKSKIANLMMSLANVKMAVATLQDVIQKKDAEIDELEKQIFYIAELKFKHGLYYQADDLIPFCPRCFEIEKKTIHLTSTGMGRKGQQWKCAECKSQY